MKITKLEFQKNDANQVNIYIDDKFNSSLNVDDLLKLNLSKGKQITPEQLNQITTLAKLGKLLNTALSFLSFRPRSEWEIRQFLRQKLKKPFSKFKKDQQKPLVQEELETLIQSVIDRLKLIKQIDDFAFVHWYLDQRTTFHPQGARALQYELIKKGVSQKLISEAISSQKKSDTELSDEKSLAFKAVEKKIKFLPEKINSFEEKMKVQKKLQQFLLGRGFDYDTIRNVVEKIIKKKYNV